MKKLMSNWGKIVTLLGIFALGYLTAITIPKVLAQQTRWDYYFTKPPVCYRGNIFLKINNQLGFDPVLVSDVQLDGTTKTLIEFDRQLTAPQETSLNTIMAIDPETPPAFDGVKTKYQFLDLYENRALLATKFNLSFHIEYSCDGSTLFVYFNKALTQGEKNNVASQVGTLLTITTQ